MRRRSPERVRVWRDVLNAWKRSGQAVIRLSAADDSRQPGKTERAAGDPRGR